MLLPWPSAAPLGSLDPLKFLHRWTGSLLFYTEIIRRHASLPQFMNAEDTADLVRRALAGDQGTLTRLVAVLTPVIQARVARTLLAHRSPLASGRDLRQEVEDQIQEVFLALFARDGRVLRSWLSERGLSLENFVGRVAERMSGNRTPPRKT